MKTFLLLVTSVLIGGCRARSEPPAGPCGVCAGALNGRTYETAEEHQPCYSLSGACRYEIEFVDGGAVPSLGGDVPIVDSIDCSDGGAALVADDGPNPPYESPLTFPADAGCGSVTFGGLEYFDQ